jgi:hypothetical protein
VNLEIDEMFMLKRRRNFIVLLVCFVGSACSQVIPTPKVEGNQEVGLTKGNLCETIIKDQPEKLAFKGMELYSWQKGDGEWVFNILYGTNRLKTIQEVHSHGMDMTAIEKCLCSMAESENVFWVNSAIDDAAGQTLPLPYPPEDIIKDIMARAENCRVNLNSPQ